MSFHAVRNKRATGSLASNGVKRFHKSPRVAIGFDRMTFDRIADEAARRKIPFSEVVREKVALSYHDSEGR